MTDAAGIVRARLGVLAAAVLFSTGGAAIKATDLDGWQVAGWRAGIAVAFLLVASRAARRGWSPRMLPVSLAFGATLLLFVLANKLTTAANTIFLQSTSPLYLLLLSPLILKERLRRRELLMLVLIGAGMTLFLFGSEPVQLTAPDPIRGNWLAALAGLSWALTITGMRWLSRHGRSDEPAGTGEPEKARAAGSMPAVVLGNGVVVLVCLPQMGGPADLDLSSGLILGFLGVVQIGVGYMFLTVALRRVPAFEASLLMMAEPVLSPVWAWWLHGESVAGWALAGGALILAASAFPALYDALRVSPSEVP